MADKPVFIHKTITYTRPELVSSEVEKLVKKLVTDEYKKIKVILHDPKRDTNSDGTSSFTIYATTVLATLVENIDISQ